MNIEYKLIPVDIESPHWAVLIGNGKFKDFSFKVDHFRVIEETEDGIKFAKENSEDVSIEFQYDLIEVPSDYNIEKGDQDLFENVVTEILMDVVMNRSHLIK